MSNDSPRRTFRARSLGDVLTPIPRRTTATRQSYCSGKPNRSASVDVKQSRSGSLDVPEVTRRQSVRKQDGPSQRNSGCSFRTERKNSKANSGGRSGEQTAERKYSIASVGASILSFSTQVAQTMNDILPSPRCQSISANDIVDNLLEQIKEAIKQRDCHQTTLPDKSMAGVKLCSGRLSGLSNLQRWGEADLDMSRNDKIYLSFTLALRDVHATYVWKRKRLRGEIAAGITRVLLHIKLRQKYQGSKSIEVFEYAVGSMEGVHAGIHGLGLLNWVAKKVVKNLVRQNLAQMLDCQAKKIIKEELTRLSILDQITYKLLPNCLLARTPSSSKDILVF